MPIGPHKNHVDGFSNSPTWFNELADIWNEMEAVPLSEIRTQAAKRSPKYLQKAFYFDQDSIPNKFGDFSTNNQQTWFRNVLSSMLEAKGLKSSEHFHISFLELHNEDYRKPDTPRICYVWKCNSAGNLLNATNAEMR